ncbi:MAG: acyl-CoA reductase [Bacteroidales bacterium]
MFEKEFKDNFSQLGECLTRWLNNMAVEPLLDSAIAMSYSVNPFFLPYMQRYAIRTIAETFLVTVELEKWAGNHSVINSDKDKKRCLESIGIIMAGNIPLVGFHDFLCVMASGRKGVIKLSSKDKYLLPAIFKILCGINSMWQERVQFVENINVVLTPIAALISTGSNSTVQAVAAKYAQVPMLLRGRRFSFAVLSGKESRQELEMLAKDVFLYYGLGCRSINYLFVPIGYNFKNLIESFSCMKTLVANECYMNIYNRGKVIHIMEGDKFIDGEFFLLRETNNVYQPIGEIGFITYKSEMDILTFEKENANHIQKKYRTFGMAQAPRIDEYADGINVMEFILEHSAIH